MENLKEIILAELSTIKREGMGRLIDYISNKTDYFTAPASMNGHSNIDGGLCLHSHFVYEILKDKCDYWRNKKPEIFIPDNDSLKIIAYFHDFAKCNFYKKGFKNVKEGKKINNYGKEVDNWVEKEVYEVEDKFPLNHGCKSVIMLQNFIKLKDYEILSIAHHMGIPETYEDKKAFHKALELQKFIILVHTADFEASVLLEEVNKQK